MLARPQGADSPFLCDRGRRLSIVQIILENGGDPTTATASSTGRWCSAGRTSWCGTFGFVTSLPMSPRKVTPLHIAATERLTAFGLCFPSLINGTLSKIGCCFQLFVAASASRPVMEIFEPLVKHVLD
jgi:hypothetical protein